jgi:hypothetical protein
MRRSTVYILHTKLVPVHVILFDIKTLNHQVLGKKFKNALQHTMFNVTVIVFNENKESL